MDHRIKEAISLLQMDPRQKLRPIDLARQIGLSVSRLQHLFKQGMGITIVEYQRRLRLDRACNLLETTRLSVKQIAAQVGAQIPVTSLETSQNIKDCRLGVTGSVSLRLVQFSDSSSSGQIAPDK